MPRNSGQPIAKRRHAMVRRGQGVFRELETVQDPGAAVAAVLVASLADQPGLRLGQGPTGRRVFFGTGMPAPQEFTRQPSPLHSADVLRAAALSGSTASRMINKTRGRAENPGERS